jgi:excisionase family DNA binding protein
MKFIKTKVTLPTQQVEQQHDPLLSNERAAEYLGITPRTLDVWRCTKRHPISFIKVGRLVKYRQSALDAFLKQQTVDAE